MGETKIIQRFAEVGYQIHPDAVAMIEEYGAPDELIQNILASLNGSVLVVKPEHIKSRLPQPTYDVKVLSDTAPSTCVGNYEEFVGYFRDRYAKLSEILRGRISARPIESINLMERGREDVTVMGMVSTIRDTSSGHRLMELEDPTGTIPILFPNHKDVFDLSHRIFLDEVIGITGTLTNDGLLIANRIVWPDIPLKKNKQSKPKRNGEACYAVLISDTHVGSKTFLEDAWHQFIKWLNAAIGDDNQKALAKHVKYLIIAGDLVDGIGVYPNQEKELAISDIYEQYRAAATLLREVPPHIKIIISPGNHDAVRQAEPQPPLPKEITSTFPPNTTFVGNPSLVELNGALILIYHGRSLDDLIAALPGASYREPEKAMVEMLKRRHLAPTYGGKTTIIPGGTDHLIIDPVPDVLHCGHIHTVGISKYRGVTLVNSGTWQSQTEFQKSINLEPVPGRASLLDLNTMETSILKFYT
ncbi:MAG: DNA-directed DNA polymerase II small subunit [Methanocellales archaeon]|nr:DNA-directed DNA polymerase II small subunit [Methanocellales archaeon]